MYNFEDVLVYILLTVTQSILIVSSVVLHRKPCICDNVWMCQMQGSSLLC